MKIQKRLPALALTLALCCAVALPAYAHDVPDESRTGSVSFVMTCDDKKVGGGSLALYRVGDVHEDDGNYSFVLSEAYAGSNVSLEDLTDTDMMETLAEYTTDNNLTGITVEIGSDGTAVAKEVPLGLYLVMQKENASGYQAITPFLVTVPMLDKETELYVYDVDAAPKMSELKPVPPAPSTTAKPTTTVTQTSTSTTTDAVALPQTGQLNWPVPVLTVLGMALFLIGWSLRFGKQGKSYGA